MQPSIATAAPLGILIEWVPKNLLYRGIVIIAQWINQIVDDFQFFLGFYIENWVVSLFPFWQKPWQVLIYDLKHDSYLELSANLKYKFLKGRYVVNIGNLTQICQILYPQNTTDFFGNRIKYLHFFNQFFT